MRFLTVRPKHDSGTACADVRLALVARRGRLETHAYPPPVEEPAPPSPETRQVQRFWTPDELLGRGRSE